MPDYDKEMGDGASDPYVHVTLLAPASGRGDDERRALATAQTATVTNARNVRWDAPLALRAPGDMTAAELRVAVSAP